MFLNDIKIISVNPLKGRGANWLLVTGFWHSGTLALRTERFKGLSWLHSVRPLVYNLVVFHALRLSENNFT